MRSPNQIEASRRNGARSRSPVTEIGKATSAHNSTKHGLCSREVVLTNEDPKPGGPPAKPSSSTGAASHWKLLRAESMETSILNAEMDILQPEIEKTFHRIDEPTRQAISIKSLADHSAVLAQLDRHQTRLSRQFDRTWKRLDQLRKDRPAPAIEQTPVVEQSRGAKRTRARASTGDTRTTSAERTQAATRRGTRHRPRIAERTRRSASPALPRIRAGTQEPGPRPGPVTPA